MSVKYNRVIEDSRNLSMMLLEKKQEGTLSINEDEDFLEFLTDLNVIADKKKFNENEISSLNLRKSNLSVQKKAFMSGRSVECTNR